MTAWEKTELYRGLRKQFPYQWCRFDQITLTILKGWIEDEQEQIEDEQRKLSAKYADNRGRLRQIEKKLTNYSPSAPLGAG